MLSRFARFIAQIGHARARDLLIACGLLLGITVATSTVLLLIELRNEVLADSARELKNLSLMLAEESDRLKAAGAIQTGLIDHMRQIAIDSPDSLATLASSSNFHRTLQDRIANLPLIASALSISAETVMLQETDATLATLHALHKLGVRIAMHDFGTGYSSLSYLRRFPFDRIKIDHPFIRDLGKRNDCRAIVRAVTSLSSELGIETTAEGVETQEQLDTLAGIGCTEVQGYLFSAAVPGSELPDLLRRLRVMAEQRAPAAPAAAWV